MKKITTILAVLLTAIVCITSCGGGSDDKKDEPTPETKAAFLTASEFASSQWGGKDAVGDISLIVSASNMTLNYYTANNGIAKSTKDPVLQTVIITYTFDETKGTFSGTGDDKAQYSGALTSKTALKLKMPTQEISLTKK
jgi:hypothetical protein